MLFPDLVSMKCQETWYKKRDTQEAVKQATVATSIDKHWSSLVVLMTLGTVIGKTIYSIYPQVNYNLRKLFHGKFDSIDKSDSQTVCIMWSRIGLDNRPGAMYIPNHFVPIVNKD